MAEYEDDLIRLSLPAERTLVPVVEVAVSVLGRRLGRSDDELTRARTAIEAAFAELVSSGGGDGIDVEIRVGHHGVAVRLERGGHVRTVDAFAG